MDSSSDLEPLDASEEAAHVLSEEDQPDVPVKRPRRPPRTLTYKLVRNFDDQTKFNDWAASNMADWHDNSEYSRGTTGEAVEVFACSTSGCPMRRRVVYDAYSFVVKVEDATVDHDHPAEESVLSKAQIKTIESLLQNGMKPAAIRLKMLEANNNDASLVPNLKQIQNTVYRLKQKGGRRGPLTDVALEEYVSAKSTLPEDENCAYVVGSIPYDDQTERFMIVWSTPKLIAVQRNSDLLATDATYKLCWHACPVIMAGTIDVKRAFHPTFVAVSSNEDEEAFKAFFRTINNVTGRAPTHLLADAAPAITNAMSAVWEECVRLMCWAHVVKAIDKKLPKKDGQTIRSAIETLQYARSELQFISVANSLLDEWARKYGSKFTFGAYFRKQWIESAHFRWFEGASVFPSTNNALESTNRTIKDSHTLRERLPFFEFTQVVERMVSTDWSAGRPMPADVVEKIPPFVFVEARELQRVKRRIWPLTSGRFAMPSTNFNDLDSNGIKEAVKALEAKEFVRFADYDAARFKVYVLERNGDSFTCTCPQGSKKKACKHAVRLAVKLDVLEYPPDALEQVIGRKKKRGRPKKAPTQREQRNREPSEGPSTARLRFTQSKESTASEEEPRAKISRTLRSQAKSHE
ncbi:SWIM-type domain-containing protein [Aphelenchoides fujianensis]|nr:SWIM-type domain-containing protein [Aphelenchoides fujianensis]KAI6225420.1 SWIM-type domain-containing protein [Aphelenchoides fujianensis]KAI6239281.1 SWIM-type domain-containing protein [Aphelenchoides fujianensis]